ncbi:hypothetical protein [Azospirillum sp.]|uniref:hypothetical protein n=1 Tax=Azospirillum sp. TaxID=34012 RepID=UPI002638D182|nr:hypothetical protein [Azospirillum sp.]
MPWKKKNNNHDVVLGFVAPTMLDREHADINTPRVALTPERRPLQHQTPALRREPVVVNRRPLAESTKDNPLRLATRAELYDASRGAMDLSRVRARALSTQDEADLALVMAALERMPREEVATNRVTPPPTGPLTVGRAVARPASQTSRDAEDALRHLG